MNDLSLALNPRRLLKCRRPPRQTIESSSRVWPLASINGRAPVVLDAGRADLREVDLAYPRIDTTDAVATCPIGTPNGTATHLMPAMTPAFAIDGGEITFAGRFGHGFGIVINHGNGWASHYANLQAIVAICTDLCRPRAQYVRAGDSIGYVGAREPGAFKQLHFELWELDRDRIFVPVDPRRHFATWAVLQHHDPSVPAPTVARTEAA